MPLIGYRCHSRGCCCYCCYCWNQAVFTFLDKNRLARCRKLARTVFMVLMQGAQFSSEINWHNRIFWYEYEQLNNGIHANLRLYVASQLFGSQFLFPLSWVWLMVSRWWAAWEKFIQIFWWSFVSICIVAYVNNGEKIFFFATIKFTLSK